MIKEIAFFVLTLNTITISAQELSGTISDDNGETIPSATIFIKEIVTGTTTNERGIYQIRLPKGVYHIVFQSLGYQTQEVTIEISNQFTQRDVVLLRQPISIREIKVYSGKEDPAYAIMRKAIAHAPKNLKAVKKFQSEIYIKGSLLIKKLPRLMANKIEVNNVKIKAGDQFTIESLNEISFQSPDHYDHKVLSTRSTFPKTEGNNDEYLTYINSSFYQPNIGITISPLSPAAFSHYRFVYEGFFLQQGYEINQIRVTPKRKSQQLFEGHIYIEEKTNQLQSVDLTNEAFFGKIRIRQTFAPVKEDSWLPVNHNFKIEVAMMGAKADASYVGSVKYKSVTLNKAFSTVEEAEKLPVADRGKSVGEQKSDENQKKIASILAKQDLSNRDMAKALRLIEKQERLNDTLRQSLEIKNNYQFIKQSDPIARSKEDWDRLRPVPLTPEEITSFQKKDSLTLNPIPMNNDSLKMKRKKPHRTNLIFGGRHFLLCDSNFTIHYPGTISPKFLSFHPVTGFGYEQNIAAVLKPDTLRTIDLSGMVRFAFSSRKTDWNIRAGYQTTMGHRYGIWLSAGHLYVDLKEEKGVNSHLNGLYNLLFKENYKILARTHQYVLEQKMGIAHGLDVTLTGRYNHFIEQQNQTNYSLFRRKETYKPNIPINQRLKPIHLSTSSQTNIDASVQYTPFLKYRRHQGVRIPMGSDYPTFTLQYRQGISSLWGSRTDYSHIQFKAEQKREWAVFYRLQWLVEAGKLFNATNLHFMQWHHFGSSNLPIGNDAWETNFTTSKPYILSTNQWYIRLSGGYASPSLFLKYLPFFSNRLWLENLYLHHVTLPRQNHYSEIGYGISGIFLFARVALFAGFDNGKINEVTFRAGFNF